MTIAFWNQKDLPQKKLWHGTWHLPLTLSYDSDLWPLRFDLDLWPYDLDVWPWDMTLTYDDDVWPITFDLDLWPYDLHLWPWPMTHNLWPWSVTLWPSSMTMSYDLDQWPLTLTCNINIDMVFILRSYWFMTLIYDSWNWLISISIYGQQPWGKISTLPGSWHFLQITRIVEFQHFLHFKQNTAL